MKYVTGNNHVTAFRCHRTKERNHLGTSQRIKTVQWLVQHQYSWVMTYGLGKPDALAHAFAIAGYVAGCSIGKIHAFNRTPCQPICSLRIASAKPKIGIYKLKACQTLGKGIELSTVADNPEELLRFAGIKSKNANPSTCWAYQGSHQVHQRGLS